MRTILAFAALSLSAAYSQPNPYHTADRWFQMPEGRTMGSTSGVAVAANQHIWMAERCEVNTCAGSNLSPILEFDASGKVPQSFGAGMFIFPHGFTIDKDGNLWLTDGQARDGKGHQVFNSVPLEKC